MTAPGPAAVNPAGRLSPSGACRDGRAGRVGEPAPNTAARPVIWEPGRMSAAVELRRPQPLDGPGPVITGTPGQS